MSYYSKDIHLPVTLRLKDSRCRVVPRQQRGQTAYGFTCDIWNEVLTRGPNLHVDPISELVICEKISI